MKKHILPLFAILLLFASCEKKEGTVYCCGMPTIEYFTDLKFKKGEITQWVGNPFTDTVKKNTVTVWSTKNDLAIKLKFNLDKAASNTAYGYNATKYEAAFYQYATSGKALVYQLDSTVVNTLQLEIRDISGGQVGEPWLFAEFKLTFKLKTPTGNLAFDTTRVYFPSGRFIIKLNK
jgi:hypothetical protein